MADGGAHNSGAWIRPELRHAIYLRDAWTCVWCGARPATSELTLDHIYPRKHPRRSHKPEHVVTACKPCNSARKDQDALVWAEQHATLPELAGLFWRLSRRREVPVDREAGKRELAKWRGRQDVLRGNVLFPPF